MRFRRRGRAGLRRSFGRRSFGRRRSFRGRRNRFRGRKIRMTVGTRAGIRM